MTTSETGAIIKTQGDTCGNRYPPWWNPDGCHKHISCLDEGLTLNRKPSAGDRRLTSFYRADTARETQYWQWSPRLQGQLTASKLYVSAPSRRISRESRLHASIPLSRDGRQPSFTAHRLQRWDFTQAIIMSRKRKVKQKQKLSKNGS